MDEPSKTELSDQIGRIRIIDIARGCALVAMAIYHFSWDLEFFGYLEPGTTAVGGFKNFARAIAGSFLFLAGFGLVLAHRTSFALRPFSRRFVQIAAAALLITIVTYFATPESYVFFGILHSIATASLLGLLFLRVPWWLTLAVGVVIFVSTTPLRSELFSAPALLWLGLSELTPRSNDYVPLFPWFAPFLAGMGVAQLLNRSNVLTRLQSLDPGTGLVTRALEWGGRRSLLVYLVHQPLLIAIIYLATLMVPPPMADPVETYLQACETGCSPDKSGEFCSRFCVCTLEGLLDKNLFNDLNDGKIDITTNAQIRQLAQQCTRRSQ